MSEEVTGVIAELRALVASQSEQLERLQRRVIELEGRGGERSAAAGPSSRIKDARVSRRNLLGKATAAAAAAAGAAVAGGVLAQPAAAAAGDALKAAYPTDANGRTSVRLYNYEDDAGFAVYDRGGLRPAPGYVAAYSRKRASGNDMPAFRGDSIGSYAFYGTSQVVPAVFGTSTGSAGVQGNCTGSGPAGVIGASTSTDGVYGLSTNGTGVHGDGVTGVLGASTNGTGVRGQSTSGMGVNGTSTSGNGVHGKSGSSFGVFGESNSSVGVQGQSNNAAGVQAISTFVAALEAHGGTYGAWLQGDAAALFLVPQAAAGKPTSGKHRRGELLCDKNGLLWFCTAPGTPGTWKKVSLV